MANNKIIDLEYIKAFRQRLDDRYIGKNERASFAELADNLTPYGDNSGVEDDTPFVFQSSGGDSDIGSYSLLKELRGNTIKWTQFLKPLVSGSGNYNNESGARTFDTANNSTTFTFDSDVAGIGARLLTNYNILLPSGHKILLKFKITSSQAISDDKFTIYVSRYWALYASQFYTLTANTEKDVWFIFTVPSDSNSGAFQFRADYADNGTWQSGTTITYRNVQMFDLTDIFGAGNEPTSELEFNRLFTKAYYQYNAAELISCKTSEYKIVGYNAFNINSPTSYIKTIAGQDYTIENATSGTIEQYDGNKVLIKTHNVSDLELTDNNLPHIVLENNCQFVKITGYTSTTCFHLTWDGTKTGYEEYNFSSREMPNVELRSIGNVYDTILPNGTYTKRIEYVDIKTMIDSQYRLTTVGNESGKALTFDVDYGYLLLHPIKAVSATTIGNIRATLYQEVSNNTSYQQTASGTTRTMDNFISIGATGFIVIISHAFDNMTTKQELLDYFTTNPCFIAYELDTPTISSTSSYIENLEIDDWGTQEFIAGDVSGDVVVPQGNSFFYAVDYKAFIDSLGQREDIDYDPSEIVSHSELTTALSQIDLSDYAKLDGTTQFSEVNFGDGAKIIKDSSNRIDLQYNSDTRIKVGNGNLNIKARIDPDSNNTYDLGRNGVAWRDLFLSRNLSDGTNSVNVADLAALIAYAKGQGWIQ